MRELFRGTDDKRNLKQSLKGFNGFIDLLEQNNHILLTEYINSSTKVLVNFNCGHEPHWITPAKYKTGRGCPRCSKVGSSYGKESMIELIRINGHKMLTEYKDAKTKVLVDFGCGHEPHWIAPTQYKGNHGCPKCNSKSPEEAKIELIQLIEDNGHELLSEYVNTHTKVLIDFNCGHEPHWIAPIKYKSGRKCPKCPDVTQVNAKNRFLKKMDEMGFKALTEYETLSKKVLIDFNCGHDPHLMIPNCILAGQGCPKCKSSKGVKRILKYLKDLDIRHTTELKLGNDRYYDIYLPDYNLLVEVHGEQHYVENDFFKRTLEEEQKNDRMKEEFAKELGYDYMVVDYREHDPVLALERFTEEFNKFKIIV